jgi:hypothetical protein
MPNPPSATPSPAVDDVIEELPTSRGFAALLASYRASGGTARGDDVARLLEDHGLGNFMGLARLIATSEVFGFEWRTTIWIPMFQFDLRDLSVRPSARMVLAELGTGFDGWARAAWFAQPNGWLQRRKPVDLMNTALPEVLTAARADRFVACG